jgi:ABC-2 type transport system permease protein
MSRMEGNGVDSVTATVPRSRYANAATETRTFWALMGAGFRRYSTYRQATVAGAFTNTVFGFLRCYVLLAVAAGAGTATVAGYDPARLATFVWFGQGLLTVVALWGWSDLAQRISTGDVVADLLRPLDLMVNHVASDLGRAGFALLTRFVVPVLAGLFAFDFYLPGHPVTYVLFAVSLLLAVLVCSALRYIVNLTAFWLLDIRGVRQVWLLASGAGSGLSFPLPLLPDWLATALWLGTPFPALMQAPLDVLVERGGTGHAGLLIAVQAGWLAIVVALARLVQRRALRRLVIQGG